MAVLGIDQFTASVKVVTGLRPLWGCLMCGASLMEKFPSSAGSQDSSVPGSS